MPQELTSFLRHTRPLMRSRQISVRHKGKGRTLDLTSLDLNLGSGPLQPWKCLRVFIPKMERPIPNLESWYETHRDLGEIRRGIRN